MDRLHFVYAFWGIVSWDASWISRYYKRATLFMMGCAAVVYPAVDLLQQEGSLYDSFSDIFFAIALVASLASLRNLDCMFGDRSVTIRMHAHKHGFFDPWRFKSMRNLVIAAFLWMYKVGTLAMQVYYCETPLSSYNICKCLFIAFQAGMYIVLVHSISHTLIFLSLMLDAYSRELHQDFDWAQSVCSWNKVQAMLHCEAAQMASCFLALQTSAALSFL